MRQSTTAVHPGFNQRAHLYAVQLRCLTLQASQLNGREKKTEANYPCPRGDIAVDPNQSEMRD
jgi:hypothetical protein